MIPAVIVNQIAAKTGAVVRNFFMASGWGLVMNPDAWFQGVGNRIAAGRRHALGSRFSEATR